MSRSRASSYLPCGVPAAIAFLATDLRNVPARHRSMRAAFDHSWALLADDERGVLRRLSVFRGGFTLEAARQHPASAPAPY